MTSTNSVFGISMAQAAKLFSVQTAERDASSRQPQTKTSTSSEAGLVSTARSIASEALDAIQSLTLGNGSSAQAQNAPGANLFEQLKSLFGGESAANGGGGQSAGASLGAFSFSFSQRITLASSETMGRGGKFQSCEISVEFSYAEGVASVNGQGSQQLASYQAFSARFSVSYSSGTSGFSRSHGESSQRQQLQCVAPAPNQQWSSSVMMASGRYESASLWTPTAAASWSKATEIAVGFQSSMFQSGNSV